MLKKFAAVAAGVFALALVTGSPASAQDKCKGAKQKAAGKTGGGVIKCDSKADAKGLTSTDIATCSAKPDASLTSGYTKADTKGPCAGTAGDAQTAINNCEAAVNTAIGNAGATRTASKCDSKIAAAMGKKLSGLLGCDSKESSKGADQSACRSAVAAKFTAAIGKLSTATDCTSGVPSAPTLEPVIDTCRTNINNTLAGAPALSLKFTNIAGSTSCGSPGLSTPPAAPFTGKLFDDTGCSTPSSVANLGRGCLYIGGGNAKAIPPGAVPAGATNYLDISGANLVASNGTGTLDCTKAAGPAKYCLNNDSLPACTSDANCGGYTMGCHEVANCYFGPPLEFPNPILSSLTTCVQNVIQTDGSGTGNPNTGDSSVTLPLSSWVYVTGNLGSPCPTCPSGTCTYGAKAGMACISGGSTNTSHDCPPERGGGAFQAPLSVTLSPLTTGSTSLTNAAGNFCPSQKTAGAFAIGTARCIQTTGNPAGNLTDGAPHAGAILAAGFCIPTTTNSTIDGVADLPGPGLTSLPGGAQIVPTP